MKKAFSFFLTLCFVLAMPFMLTSCGGHNYATDWTYNEEYHWHACTDDKCDEVKDKTKHNWVEQSKTHEKVFYKCSDCTATKTHTHTKASTWLKDETHHWKGCTDSACSKKYDKNEHNWGTAVVDGFKTTFTCLTCEYEKVEIEEHTHSASEWHKDQTNHWKVCTNPKCEETLDLNSHSFGAPVVNDDSTTQTSTCEVCGYEKIESYVPGHTHEYDNWSTSETNHWKVCVGDDCEQIVENALHEWDEGSTEDGTVTYTCKTCGYTKGHTHTYSGTWVKNDEQHWKVCDEFGCEVKGEVEDHSWNSGVTSGDTVTYTCLVCGGVKEHTHSFTNTWTHDETHHWKVCDKKECGEIAQKTEHTWGKGTVKGDTITYNCTVCLATKEESYVAPPVSIQDYVLKLTNFEILTDSLSYKVKVGELYYEINEDGDIVGYGVCTLVDHYSGIVLTEANVILDGNYMYLYSMNKLEDYSKMYAKMSMEELASTYVTLLESRTGMTFAEMQEYVAEYQETIDKILESITNLLEINAESLESFKANLIENLFFSEVSDTTVTYTFNFEYFKNLNNYLERATIEEIFGKDVFASVKDFMVDSLDSKVGEIIATLEENGVTVEDILNYLDMLANYACNFVGTGEKVPSDDNVSMADVYSMVDVVETITFEEFLAMIGYELPVENIEELLTPEMEEKTLTEVLNMILNKEYTTSEYEDLIDTLFITINESTIYELIEVISNYVPVDSESLKTNIDSLVDMLDSILNISYVTDSEGVVLNVCVDVNIPGTVSGKIEYIKDYESTIDYEELRDEYEEIINSYELTKEMLGEVEGYTRTETTDGENTVITYVSVTGDKAVAGYYLSEEYTFTFNASGLLIKFEEQFEEQSSYEDEEGYLQVYHYIFSNSSIDLENGYLIYVDDVCKDGFAGIMISSSNAISYRVYVDGEIIQSKGYSFTFYYDTKNNAIYFYVDDYEELAHSFVEIKSDRMIASSYYLIHMVCENCGEDCYVQLAVTVPVDYNDAIAEVIAENFGEEESIENYYLVLNDYFVYEYNSAIGKWKVNFELSVEEDLEYAYTGYERYAIYTVKTVEEL